MHPEPKFSHCFHVYVPLMQYLSAPLLDFNLSSDSLLNHLSLGCLYANMYIYIYMYICRLYIQFIRSQSLPK